jgi:hypothetical protein
MSELGNRVTEKMLDKIYDTLIKIDQRLETIENSIKNEQVNKNNKWYKDTNKQLLQE